MKILVPCKRVPDPDQRITVSAEGKAIDQSELSFVVNPFDLIALEQALRLREEDETLEVVAVGVGVGVDAYEKVLRTALAMGAGRALLIETEQSLDPWNVASILRAVVDREQPDIVLMGKQAVDDDANQVGQFLAAILDWPQATFISKLTLADGHANIERETDAGIESGTLSLPAVMTADLRLNEPRYASMLQMMKAKKKIIERFTLKELGVAVEPRIEMIGIELLSSRRECQMLSSVDELLHKLQNEAEVI